MYLYIYWSIDLLINCILGNTDEWYRHISEKKEKERENTHLQIRISRDLK